ncbi:MAG: endopeptidase La [Deltaproteobacteria bacterium]|nr:MAG: endopeptidase La [Deltaproteobacteria bacterium]
MGIFRDDDEPKKSRVTQTGAPPARKSLPLLPLRDIVVFPHMVVPLFVGRQKSIEALEDAMNGSRELLLCAQREAAQDEPNERDIYEVGTLGTIIQLLRLPDGTVKVLVEGKARARIRGFVSGDPFFSCEYEPLPDDTRRTVEGQALVRTVHTTFESYIKLNKKVPPETLNTVVAVTEPGRLADTIVAHLNLKLEERQELLETLAPAKRLEDVYGRMQAEIEVLEVERKIRGRVKKQMERSQKEYYLNEQMRAIQKELGERDEFKNEIEELEEQLKAKKMPEEARARADKEIKKLKMMSPMSAEATVVRNYIDWIISLPWEDYKDETHDITEAERVLAEDHYGLEKPKERIIEYLAVQSLVERMKGPILCLVGPPGVGKTSLGKSIARATGRDFVRVSLGGVRDEAEIRGHRRTYIGALPGKILQSLKKAGSGNPVFLLDEVDKMSMDFRGDPSAALLEVLDPEQNHTFNDHYLDLDYDLSRVMFVCTANVLSQIPRPLQDRMEIITLPGYIENEKLSIATEFLVPKQREANGLTEQHISFTDTAILEIIRYYTRESGVRSLEREIASVCRKIARHVVKAGPNATLTKITPQKVKKLLGVPKYRFGQAEEADRVGVCTGLAYTEVGGELLQTEVSVTPGKGKLQVTGRLGEVMQESANAALSYVRTRAKQLGLTRDFYSKVDLHIHVPEGATPKDGPSAGITIATAIASALTRVPIRSNVAMTGEITLRGRVLPIGGLKEKMIAALRGGIDTVLIPKENEKDLADIPPAIRRGLRIVTVEHMDEVLAAALSLAEPAAFLREGDHDFDDIHEIAPPPTAKPVDLPIPAGVN